MKIFSNLSTFVDSISYLPSARIGVENKIRKYYPYEVKDNDLVINIVKSYHKQNLSNFECFGIVLNGTLKEGQSVLVTGLENKTE